MIESTSTEDLPQGVEYACVVSTVKVSSTELSLQRVATTFGPAHRRSRRRHDKDVLLVKVEYAVACYKERIKECMGLKQRSALNSIQKRRKSASWQWIP